MGIFNFFIVIPEILASLGFGWVMLHLLDNDRLAAVVAGGVFLVLAAMLVLRVHDAAAAVAGARVMTSRRGSRRRIASGAPGRRSSRWCRARLGGRRRVAPPRPRS